VCSLLTAPNVCALTWKG